MGNFLKFDASTILPQMQSNAAKSVFKRSRFKAKYILEHSRQVKMCAHCQTSAVIPKFVLLAVQNNIPTSTRIFKSSLLTYTYVILVKSVRTFQIWKQ